MRAAQSPSGKGHVPVCHALALALAGYPVFPCSQRKQPLTAHGCKDATANTSQIFAWWVAMKPRALGLATGSAAGLWVLDVDSPKVGRPADGRSSLANLEEKFGPIPITVEQMTGGGGRHLFFAWPQKGLPIRNSAGKVGPGLDVRGEGGYVILPPSLHSSGNRYAWAEGRALDGMKLAQAPAWLLALARGESIQPAPVSPASPARHQRTTAYGQSGLADELVALAGAMKGKRNEALNRAAFRLGRFVAEGQLEQGQIEAALLDTALGLGLSEREGRATIKSGLQAGLREPVALSRISPTRDAGAAKEDEWQPDIKNWPELPRAALYGLAGEFVRLACRDSEADPAAVLVNFLARFGIEVGASPHVLVGDAKHPPRLFAVVVGASSKARKGTSGQLVDRAFSFAVQHSAHIPAHKSPGPLSSGEGLVWSVRDSIEAWQVDRKTGEGKYVTVDPGEENKRLFVLDEELAAALQCTKREGNTLSTVLRTLWDTGNVEPLTKTAKAKTTGAHVGVVTHITAPELAQLLDEIQAFNGFANRFLWVCARRQKLVPLPQPMPTAEIAVLQRRILAALEMERILPRLDLDQEARALWLSAYPKLSQDHPGLAGTVINRGEAQVLRLALVYALLDRSNEIRTEHLNAALTLWGYCRDSALYIFGPREADPVARRVLAALAEGPVSASGLFKCFANSISKARLGAALQELVASGRVEQAKEAGVTKPRIIYRLTEKSELSELSRPHLMCAEENSDYSDNSLAPSLEGNPQAVGSEVAR